MNVSAEQLEDLPVTDEENYVNEIAEYIPKELKGHIIISAEGDAPLQSLALLLRNLWHKEYRKALRLKRREKVIIIHSNINDEVKKKFERFDGKSFFVEGSPTSDGTWRKARLSSANAVPTVADIS